MAAVSVTSGRKGEVRIWNFQSRQRLGELSVLKGEPTLVAFHPQGSRLAVATDEPSIALCDWRSDKVLFKLKGIERAATALAFDSQGKALATGDAAGNVVLWDVATGQKLGRFTGSGRKISGVVFSSDGIKLATVDSELIRLWDVRLGALRRIVQHPSATFVDFDPASELLVAANSEGNAMAWNAGCDHESILGRYENPLEIRDVPAIGSRVFDAPDATVLFGAGPTVWNYDAALRLIVRRFEGHRSKVRAVVFSAPDQTVISGSEDGTVRGWDFQTAEPRWSLDIRQPDGELEPVWSLALAPDGRRLLIGTDRSVFLCDDFAKGNVVRLERLSGAALAVDWSPDGLQGLAAGWRGAEGKGFVEVFRLAAAGEPRRIGAVFGPVTDAVFVGDGSELAFLSGDSVAICQSDDGREVRRLRSHAKRLGSTLSRSPDGRYLALGVGTGLSVFDAQTGEVVLRSETPGQGDPPAFIEFGRNVWSVSAVHGENFVSWLKPFPTRAMVRSVGSPFSNTTPANAWYDSGDKDYEIVWRRMELGRPSELRFEGPADAPQLADFHADGGWAVNDERLLLHQPGAGRAAVDLGEMQDAQLTINLDLEGTNCVFVMLGWNGRDGHLVYKAPHDAGGVWKVCSSRDGGFRRGASRSLGAGVPPDPAALRLDVQQGKLLLEVNGEKLIESHPLPEYRKGRVAFGIVDNRPGDLPARVHRLSVKFH